MVSLMKLAAVELSVCIGDLGCFHPISSRVFQRGIISLAIRSRADNLASAAEDTTYFMTWESVRTGPFVWGIGSFSNRKMWAPA